MRPKSTMILLLCILTVILAGCGNKEVDSVNVNDTIKQQIENESIGCENLIIYTIEKFQNTRVVLYAYDLADKHYMACRHVTKDNRLSGGFGPNVIDTEYPFSIHSGGGSSEQGSYLLNYGEVNNENIDSIQINYSDNTAKKVSPKKGAFLIIKEEANPGVLSAVAKDSRGKIIYEIP